MKAEKNLNLTLTDIDDKVVTISRANIKDFDAMEHARPLRPGHIRKLHGLLISGQHFEAPMVVNVVTVAGKKRYRLIDGNHRLEGIRRWLKNNNGSIDVRFIIYKNLSPEEEKNKYDKWNSGAAASTSDRVYVRQDEFPILQMMWKKFPARVYTHALRKDQTGFQFLPLTRAYMARTIMSGVGTDEFMDRAKLLNEGDYKSIYQFAEDFTDIFGECGGGNMWGKAPALHAICKVYYCNLPVLGRDEVVKRLRKVRGNKMVEQMVVAAGMGGVDMLHKYVIEAMNSGHGKEALTVQQYRTAYLQHVGGIKPLASDEEVSMLVKGA